MSELETDTTLLEPARDETALVQSWRIIRFLDLGYDIDTAIDAATSTLDLHQVAHLLERGCPLPTALEILL